MKKQRTRIAAYGLICDADRLLLCRLSSQLPRWQGQWTLPGGGIEFGEHPENAMVREVMEETGLRVDPGSLVTINSILDESGEAAFHGVQIIYNARYLGGELRHELQGTTDRCQWCTRQEIDALELVDIAAIGVNQIYGA
jgi:ADP-ribose pyrophosphatase YjhB (NUDIX family)